jgi:hypothetical protein
MENKVVKEPTLIEALLSQWKRTKMDVAENRTSIGEFLFFAFLTVVCSIFGFCLVSLGLWGLLALLKCVIKSIF